MCYLLCLPAMGSCRHYVNELWGLVKRPRLLLAQMLNLGCVVLFALMLHRGLMVFTNSSVPVLVVQSGDGPGFQRGDILFLAFCDEPFKAGQDIVFQVEGRDFRIVHRLLEVHESHNGTLALLTKGDDNQVDDRGLYPQGQRFIGRREVMGQVQAYLPFAGMIAILLAEYPWYSYWQICWTGFFFLIGRRGWTWSVVFIGLHACNFVVW